MRNFGAILAVVGLVWGILAFNMPTTVKTQGETIGSGDFTIDVPSLEVYNLSLSERRNTQLLISGLLVVIGTVLFGFGSIRRSSFMSAEDSRKCPFCAELVKAEAIICKHCGKDISVLNDKSSVNNLPKESDLEVIKWKCKKCGEGIEGQFSECWKCGASREE